MNKKGVLLVELLISTSFIFIIVILILNATLYVNNMLTEKIQIKKINEEKAIIYKEIATLFSTKNITSITKNNDTYTISYSKHTVDQSSPNSNIGGTSIIKFENNKISIDNQIFKSNDYFEYKDLDIEKFTSKTNSNYFYIVLTIGYTYLNEYDSMKFYYVNDNVRILNDIREVYYE